MLARAKAIATEKAASAQALATELRKSDAPSNALSSARQLAISAKSRATEAARPHVERLREQMAELNILPPTELADVGPTGFSAHEEVAILSAACAAHGALANGFEQIADEPALNVRVVGRCEDGTVTVSFRGSVIRGAGGELDVSNWVRVNVRTWPVHLAEALGGPSDPKHVDKSSAALVHQGFQRAYLSVRDAVLTWLLDATGRTTTQHVVRCVGHSLGGALATVCAYDLLHTAAPWADTASVQLVTFGAPRVGNARFVAGLEGCAKHARFVHSVDPVPHFPPHPLGFCHAVPAHGLLEGQASHSSTEGDAPSGPDEVQLAVDDVVAEALAEDDAAAAVEAEEAEEAVEVEVEVEVDSSKSSTPRRVAARAKALGSAAASSAAHARHEARIALKMPEQALAAHKTRAYGDLLERRMQLGA